MRTCTLKSAAALCTLVAFSAFAGTSVQTKPLRIGEGGHYRLVDGSFKGDQVVDYTLTAKTGSVLNVKLETRHTATYFNVLPPNSDTALFVGSISGNEWRSPLAEDGLYRIRVYMMRSAARRSETASYKLSVTVAGNTLTKAPLGIPRTNDAKVTGTPYHATSMVPCHLGDGAELSCEVGVIRGKPGNAELYVTSPSGLKRVLRFIGSKVDSEGSTVKAVKQSDLWSVGSNVLSLEARDYSPGC